MYFILHVTFDYNIFYYDLYQTCLYIFDSPELTCTSANHSVINYICQCSQGSVSVPHKGHMVQDN